MRSKIHFYQTRREHLLAVNARLRNSLSSGVTESSPQPPPAAAGPTPLLASNYATSGFPQNSSHGYDASRNMPSTPSAFSDPSSPPPPAPFPESSMGATVEKKEFKTPQHTPAPDSKEHLKIFDSRHDASSSSLAAARPGSPKTSPMHHHHHLPSAVRAPAHYPPADSLSRAEQYSLPTHGVAAAASLLQHQMQQGSSKMSAHEAEILRQQQLILQQTAPFTELKDPRAHPENPSSGVDKLLLQEQFHAALSHGDAVVLQQRALASALASAAAVGTSPLSGMSQQQLQQFIPALNTASQGLVFQMMAQQPVTDLSQRPPSCSPRK